jgi:hypothetical protein
MSEHTSSPTADFRELIFSQVQIGVKLIFQNLRISGSAGHRENLPSRLILRQGKAFPELIIGYEESGSVTTGATALRCVRLCGFLPRAG